MQDELPFLIKLQDHDRGVDELSEKIEALLPLIQAKNQKIDSLKNGLKSAKESLSGHQLKKKQLELDGEIKEKEVQKHQSELNSLKSNDAYKAMLSEIQAAKDAVVKIEDEILVVMEALEKDDRALKEKEKQLKSEESVIRSEIQNLESQKAAIEAEKTKKQEEREVFAATVPVTIRSQYEAIREKRGGIAIVPLVNGHCGGCRMMLTPNKANEVKKAKVLVLCDSCSRIIFLPQENVAPPADASAVASSNS